MARIFIDTNIIVYAFSNDQKAARAQALLDAGFVTSVQALNEFVNVARRRLGINLSDTERALKTIRILCSDILPVNIDTHEGALQLLHRHNFSTFDALMISSALSAGCEYFLSEDMQHGLKVARQLTIKNPFLAS